MVVSAALHPDEEEEGGGGSLLTVRIERTSNCSSHHQQQLIGRHLEVSHSHPSIYETLFGEGKEERGGKMLLKYLCCCTFCSQHVDEAVQK